MENIFGNIELVPVNTLLECPSPVKTGLLSPRPKQLKPPVMRHSLDYQQVKRRAESIQEIQQLKDSIKETQQKNLALFNGIMSLSPDFAHVLFQSKNYQNQNYGQIEEMKLLERKLMSELDKLYEENVLLEKQLNRVKFIQQNEDKLKSESLNSNITHYQFLRNIWHHKAEFKNDPNEVNKSEDLIEKLNKKVAAVRQNINHIIKEEVSNQNKKLNNEAENDFIVKSQKYQQLLKAYEHASMQLEDQRNISWNHAEQRKRTQVLELENKQKNVQIQNLTSRIKYLETQAYENQQQIRFLKEQLQSKDTEVHKFESLIEKLKGKSNLVEESSLNSELQKLSAFRNEKQISLRSILNDVDLNKIKTDRMSLIKKTNKLNETFNGSNNVKRNVSKQKQQRVSETSMQNKENMDLSAFVECYKENSSDFPSQVSSINLETDFKAKFVRTTNKNKRECLR